MEDGNKIKDGKNQKEIRMQDMRQYFRDVWFFLVSDRSGNDEDSKIIYVNFKVDSIGIVLSVRGKDRCFGFLFLTLRVM